MRLYLRLIHITEKETGSAGPNQVMVDNLLNQMHNLHKDVRILYEHVWNIVQQAHSSVGNFFMGSHTQKLSRVTEIPLLVFPHIETTT